MFDVTAIQNGRPVTFRDVAASSIKGDQFRFNHAISLQIVEVKPARDNSAVLAYHKANGCKGD